MSKTYPLNLDLYGDELARVKHHVSVLGYKSVRDFAKQAIIEKLDGDIAKLPAEKRQAVETLLKQKTEDDTDSLV